MKINSLNQLNQEKTYILACSGGADSVFLGEQLFQQGFRKIITAHFNHNLRAKESDQDEKFCQEMTKKWGFKFISEKWQKPEKSEEKARKARHDFLEKTREQEKAELILLAHHFDDNAETILFNFLRGTGLKGLTGMEMQENFLYRPLLNISKQEILDYLNKNKISHREDSSNQNNEFARNFIRNELFPLIESRFPESKKALNRTAKINKRASDFIEQEAQKWLTENFSQQQGADKQKFLNLAQILQTEILRQLWQPFSLDFEQIENLRQFIESANSNKKITIRQKTLKIFGQNFFME